MESLNLILDEKTDPVTKQILQNVVKRKKNLDTYKMKHKKAVWSTLFLLMLFFAYMYFSIIKNYSYSFSAMFSSFVENPGNLLILMAVIGMYGYTNMLKERMEKAEKEFHDLRCEIVDRSRDLWKKEDEWQNRYLVFEMMKKNFDINLYHEKK